MLREAEPVFEELNGHLGGLVGQCSSDAEESSPLPVIQQFPTASPAAAFAPPHVGRCQHRSTPCNRKKRRWN
ncbi:MAG: hypothetical protein HC849_28915 [Oscillatoriales cyanobacterium RU_3_3]|nr:hypothetical protein [Oscillatoriales cyanobacterium RU_3_3]